MSPGPDLSSPMNTSLPLLRAAALAAVLLAAPLFSAQGDKPAKPARVSQGQEIDLNAHAVKGRTTIFDFTSEYCPPCRAIAPKLDALHAKRADIVVVKVDINRPGIEKIDWQSPVAKQYALRSVPHFKVFGPDGKLQAEGDAARQLVNGWLN
jgi:thiol-disulfide isomerase/thioredoxin